MMTKEELCKNLKALRISMGMSQAQMADKMGIARETLSKFENGKTRVYSRILGLMADASGWFEYEIIAGGRMRKGSDGLLEAYDGFEEKRKELVDNFIKELDEKDREISEKQREIDALLKILADKTGKSD